MSSCKMNLLKVAMHPINFSTSWRLSESFILVIADTVSRLGSIPRWETIHPSSFLEGTTTKCVLFRVQLHFEFPQVVEGLCQVRDESLVFLSLKERIIYARFSVAPKL
jgi:hypothetical protein